MEKYHTSVRTVKTLVWYFSIQTSRSVNNILVHYFNFKIKGTKGETLIFRGDTLCGGQKSWEVTNSVGGQKSWQGTLSMERQKSWDGTKVLREDKILERTKFLSGYQRPEKDRSPERGQKSWEGTKFLRKNKILQKTQKSWERTKSLRGHKLPDRQRTKF